MKRISKTLLLTAAIIAVSGLLVCLFALGVCSKTGEQIYSSKIGDERGYTYEFGDKNADKIKINVTDADVTVIGGSEKSYIEVINFNEILSSYVANNAMISFTETVGATDAMGNLESILSFKGLRYILRPVPPQKSKAVNIYLSGEEKVKAFDIKINRGNVRIENISTLSDYDVKMESGKLYIGNVHTESTVEIEATGDMVTEVTFAKVSAYSVTLSAKRAKFTGEGLVSHELEMNVTAGSAAFDFTPAAEEYAVDIVTKGKLTVDGIVHLDKYKYPEKAPEDTDEEGEEPSSLKIIGDDFAVNLETPDDGKTADTEDKE